MKPFTTLKKENWYAGRIDHRDKWLSSTRESVIERNSSAMLTDISRNRHGQSNLGTLSRNREARSMYKNDEVPFEPSQTSSGQRGFHSGVRVNPQTSEKITGKKHMDLRASFNHGQIKSTVQPGLIHAPESRKPLQYMNNYTPSAKGGNYIQQTVQEKYDVRRTRYFSEPSSIVPGAFSKVSGHSAKNFYEASGKNDDTTKLPLGNIEPQFSDKMVKGAYANIPKVLIKKEDKTKYTYTAPHGTRKSHPMQVKPDIKSTLRSTEDNTVGSVNVLRNKGEVVRNMNAPDSTTKDMAHASRTGGADGSFHIHKTTSNIISPIDATRRDMHKVKRTTNPTVSNSESGLRTQHIDDTVRSRTGKYNPVQAGSFISSSVDSSEKRMRNENIVHYSGNLHSSSKGLGNYASFTDFRKRKDSNRDIISNRSGYIHSF